MKRIMILALVALLSLALFAFPAFADGNYVFEMDDRGQAVYNGVLPSGAYCLELVGDGNEFLSNPFSVELEFDANGIAVWSGYAIVSTSQYTEAFQVMLNVAFNKTYIQVFVEGFWISIPATLIPYEGTSFLSYVENGIDTILGWVLMPVFRLMQYPGTFSILFFAFVVPVAISVVFLAIYIIRKFIWGA